MQYIVLFTGLFSWHPTLMVLAVSVPLIPDLKISMYYYGKTQELFMLAMI